MRGADEAETGHEPDSAEKYLSAVSPQEQDIVLTFRP